MARSPKDLSFLEGPDCSKRKEGPGEKKISGSRDTMATKGREKSRDRQRLAIVLCRIREKKDALKRPKKSSRGPGETCSLRGQVAGRGKGGK